MGKTHIPFVAYLSIIFFFTIAVITLLSNGALILTFSSLLAALFAIYQIARISINYEIMETKKEKVNIMKKKSQNTNIKIIALILGAWVLVASLFFISIVPSSRIKGILTPEWGDAVTPLNPCFFAGEDKAITPLVLIVWLFFLPATIFWGCIFWIFIAIMKPIVSILSFKIATCGVAGAIC